MYKVQTKKCKRCGRTLPVTEFYRNEKTKDGYECQCRECESAASLRTYRKNAIKAAKELYYGDKVIKRIKVASTENQIRIIMSQAREKL